MQIVIVNLRLDGITEQQYRQTCDDVAPAFADVPGLVSKVWLADTASGTYGGVCTFSSAAAVDAFLTSELFTAVGETPGLVDISVRRFGVLEEPTAVTRGLTTAAV